VRAYRIAYDGQPYYGFQRQPNVPTVEDTVLDALAALDILCPEDTPPGYAAAGRTDAGVSAVAQTVAFEAPEWLSPAAFNSELPRSIRVWASADAPADFHATHHAREREYTYFLHADNAAFDRARQALELLEGDHDFHNLTPDEDGTRRDLSTEIEQEGQFFVISLRAGGFPRQLVRRVVSIVAEFARSDADKSRLEDILSPKTVDGPDGVGPAPAYPLVLTGVSYPELSFTVDTTAAEGTVELFDQQCREYETRAEVSGFLAERVRDH